MKHEMDRLLGVVERYLIEGREGGTSLKEALDAAGHLRAAIELESVTGKWYRHRIVKRKVVPEAQFLWDPLATEAKRELSQEVEKEVAIYFRSHKHCQKHVESFCLYSDRGLTVMVVATLYGPGSIRDESLEELVRKGEMN